MRLRLKYNEFCDCSVGLLLLIPFSLNVADEESDISFAYVFDGVFNVSIISDS